MKTLRLLVSLGLMLLPGAATAQNAPQPGPGPAPGAGPVAGQRLTVDISGGISQPMPIAIPVMPTPSALQTPAGPTDALGSQVSDVITNDLKNSGLFAPLSKGQLKPVSFPQVPAPDYGAWLPTGAQALVQGYVQANGDGTLTVGCYLYDVFSKTEMVRQGFVVKPSDWRRGAHKCADTVYSRLTGEGPYFDSQVIYVSETGPKKNRTKRLAIMDQDGASHRFITNGQSLVLTPRFAPSQQTVVFMSFENDQPRVYVYDVGSGRKRLVVNQPYTTFAPRFSPDGRFILFSMIVNGNCDIYRVSAGGGTATRLTTSPGIDTGGSYSPDGAHIVFESDRSGTQQLYVMGADGGGQHRISFGSGRYATPVWSPRGDLIAYTHLGGGFSVGVMIGRQGSDQRLAGRRPDLVAQRPRADVLPYRQRFGQGRFVVGRPDRRQRTCHPDTARWIGSRLGTVTSLN